MFECSTVGCKASFLTTRWLIEHEIKGVHQFAAKKTTMTDLAVSKFTEMIETREAARLAVSEQVESVTNNSTKYGN